MCCNTVYHVIRHLPARKLCCASKLFELTLNHCHRAVFGNMLTHTLARDAFFTPIWAKNWEELTDWPVVTRNIPIERIIFSTVFTLVRSPWASAHMITNLIPLKISRAMETLDMNEVASILLITKGRILIQVNIYLPQITLPITSFFFVDTVHLKMVDF